MTNVTIKKHKGQYLITIKRDEGNIQTIVINYEELLNLAEAVVKTLQKE